MKGEIITQGTLERVRNIPVISDTHPSKDDKSGSTHTDLFPIFISCKNKANQRNLYDF